MCVAEKHRNGKRTVLCIVMIDGSKITCDLVAN